MKGSLIRVVQAVELQVETAICRSLDLYIMESLQGTSLGFKV